MIVQEENTYLMQGGVQMRNIGLTMQECMRELQAIGIELGYVIDIRWRRMNAFGIFELPIV